MKRLFTRIFARRLSTTLERSQGGIFKRIDENRELAILLAREVPNFVREHPQVFNLLKAQDQFMTELAGHGLQRPERCLFKPRKGMPREFSFQPANKGGRRG